MSLASWTTDRARCDDAGLAAGELVHVAGSGPALVTQILRDHTELAPLANRPPARADAEIIARGPFEVPSGEALIGRVVDPLGVPLDGGAPIARTELRRVMPRLPTTIPIETHRPRQTFGLLALDLAREIRAGCSIVVGGTRAHLHHVARHLHATGRVVIFACPVAGGVVPARRGAAPLGFSHVAVTVARDATPTAQWLVPWSAMAIADGFRARGRHAVVVLDHLDAWRLPVARMPLHGGWLAQVGRLSSHAYATPAGSAGIIALGRTIDPGLGDSFDRALDLAAAAEGHVPTGTRFVRPPFRVRQLGGFGAIAGAIVSRIARDDAFTARIRACIRYRPGATVDSLEQMLALIAVVETPSVPLDALGAFVDAYLATVRHHHADRLAAIRAAGVVEAGDRAYLRDLATTVAEAV